MTEIEDAIAGKDYETTKRLVSECLAARAQGRYCECHEPDEPGVAVTWLGEPQCVMCRNCGLCRQDGKT